MDVIIQWGMMVLGVVVAGIAVAKVRTAWFAIRKAILARASSYTPLSGRAADESHDSSDDEIDQTIPF